MRLTSVVPWEVVGDQVVKKVLSDVPWAGLSRVVSSVHIPKNEAPTSRPSPKRKRSPPSLRAPEGVGCRVVRHNSFSRQREDSVRETSGK